MGRKYLIEEVEEDSDPVGKIVVFLLIVLPILIGLGIIK